MKYVTPIRTMPPRRGSLVGDAQLLDGIIPGCPMCQRIQPCVNLLDHLPSVALIPSQTAPTNPVTITVMTALNV
jgi:hypothetical protein